MENLAAHWKNKKVCFLGDSITEGVGVSKDTVYWNLLAEKLGIISLGYGTNGARFLDLFYQSKKMFEENQNDIDAVFLFAGTNDFNGGVPLGDWFIESEKIVAKTLNTSLQSNSQIRKYREFNYDTKTFKGCINLVLSYLKTNYPDKQIVLMTPIHRAYATFGNENVQYDEMHSNAIGVFFDEYVMAVKEAANIWSTELIDTNACSGFFPLYDKSANLYFCNFFTDRLHPNSIGHQRLAETIAKKMINIPVF